MLDGWLAEVTRQFLAEHCARPASVDSHCAAADSGALLDAAGLVVLRQERVQILLAVEDALQRVADVAARIVPSFLQVVMIVSASAARRALSSWPRKSHVLRSKTQVLRIAFYFVIGQLHQQVVESASIAVLLVGCSAGLAEEPIWVLASPTAVFHASSSATSGTLSRLRRATRCSTVSLARFVRLDVEDLGIAAPLRARDDRRSRSARRARADRARCAVALGPARSTQLFVGEPSHMALASL